MLLRIIKILGIVLIVVAMVSIGRIFLEEDTVNDYEQGEITGYLLFMILGFVLFYLGNRRSNLPS